MFLSEWREFPSAPCRAGKNYLVTPRVSMLLKSRASLTCFRACFLPGRAKDLSAPPVPTSQHCETSQEIEDVIYATAEVSYHALLSFLATLCVSYLFIDCQSVESALSNFRIDLLSLLLLLLLLFLFFGCYYCCCCYYYYYYYYRCCFIIIIIVIAAAVVIIIDVVFVIINNNIIIIIIVAAVIIIVAVVFVIIILIAIIIIIRYGCLLSQAFSAWYFS